MCFRPAIVEAAFFCPECSKKINPIMGQLPKECPFCNADISVAAVEAMANSKGAPPEASFGKPVAPGAPETPGAPVSPTASPSSKPPSAPEA